MRRLVSSAALALTLAAGALSGCTPAVINAGGDGADAPMRRSADAAVAVRIVDPGQIFSDYNLRGDDEAEAAARAGGVSAAQWQQILRLSTESAWPSGLRDVAGRARLRTEIRSLRATRVAAFRDKVLIFVPAAQPDVSAEAQGRDYYLVVGESGITIVGN